MKQSTILLLSFCFVFLSSPLKAQHLNKTGECPITNGYGNDLIVAGSNCYVATSKGIETLQYTSSGNFTSLGKAGFDFADETGLSIGIRDNNYVYLGSNYALSVFDVSNKQNPYSVKRNTTSGEVQSIIADGNRVFITRNNFGFAIADIAQPQSSPVYTGRYPGSNNPWMRGLSINGNTAYVTKYIENTLLLLDISNAASVSLQKSFAIARQGQANTPKLYNVFVSGNYAYLANGQNGLVIVDVSDLGNIHIKGSVLSKSQDHGIVDVIVNGNYAYLADAESGIRIIDISDPSAPLLHSTIDIPEGASRLRFSNGKLFCINNSVNNSKVLLYTSSETGLNEATVSMTPVAYPNPASNELTVTTNRVAEINLYDVTGRKIAIDSRDPEHINITNIADGIYILTTSIDQGTVNYSQKIIIKH